MKHPHDIIIAPVITERSTTEAALGKYTFRVDVKATKLDIRRACEQLFNVKVLSVNTMRMLGKEKRVGVHIGRTPAWKKAIVTVDTEPKAEQYQTKGGKQVDAAKKYKNSIEEFGYGQ